MRRGNFELLLVTLIWGINSIAVKDALSSFSPLQFNAVRLSLAALVLVGILAKRGSLRCPSASDWPALVLAGFLGNTVYQFMFIKGIALSTAGNTSFVLATMPATTAVLSHLLGRQRMTGRMWLGVTVTILGVVLITLGGTNGVALDPQVLRGDLITLSGTLGWCLCTILASDLTKRMSPLEFTTWTMIPGALILIPLSVPELLKGSWRLAPSAWFELVFSAVFAIALAYILWNRGIKESGPASTAIFGNLTPVWTGLFGWLLLDERWGPIRFAGALVILLGVTLVRMGSDIWPSKVGKEIRASLDERGDS